MEYVNKGDYSYWKDVKSIKDFDKSDTNIDRSLYVNGESMANVIFPANPLRDYEGDIVPIGDYEGQQFAYAWWRDSKNSDDRMAYGRLRGKGYEVATTDHFRVVRETFYVDNGRIQFGDSTLMACPADRWEAEQKKEREFEARRTGESLDRVDDDFSESVRRTSFDAGIKFEPIAKTKASSGKRK